MEPITNFKGIFARDDAVQTPQDHFIDALNIEFPFGGVETRTGTVLDLTTNPVRRKVLYKRINEASRMLILTENGNLYDSTSLSAPIITIPGMTDFSAVNFFNRMYISPHNGTKGLAATSIYVYDGTTIRVAGGSQPTGVMTATESGVSGQVDAGTHLFAVVIESPSGHYSKPGPVVFASVLSTGDKKIDLAGIPAGPAGTTRRRMIATRAIETYDGNQFGQEYWFIPDAVIENNVDTTLTVDFYDAELQESADYLFDIRETIPAGLVLSSYKGRMLVGNLDGDQSLLLVSRVNEPETFDAADDIVVVDPTEAGGVTNAVEHHGLLLLMKSFRSYTTQDNGQEPSTWEVLPFDKSIGTEVHGIGTILDANGTTIDRFLMASRSGLVLYDGTFRDPELTYKIKNLWKRINKEAFHTVEVALNPLDKQIFIAVPLDSATSPSHILYGDYSDGLSFENIKWAVWSFPWAPQTIVVDLVQNLPILKIGAYAGNVYKKSAVYTSDNGTAIDNYIQFALLPNERSGIIRHFNWFRVNMTGSGNVEVSTISQNNVSKAYNDFTISSTVQDLTRLINFEGERCSIKLQLDAINERFKLNSFMLNFYDKWTFRPQ